MRQVVCAVFDSAVGAYMQPMFAPSVGVVVRSFADEVNRKESPMYAHPEDYVLWKLGEFDAERGLFMSDGDCPLTLSRGKDVKRDGELPF